MNAKGELISFRNSKGNLLNGILYEAAHSRKTIIHIHGSYGNFYQASFIQIMANIYLDEGYSFLSFNLTCHDGFSEGNENNSGFEYTGGAISDFNSCISDIEGAINYSLGFSDSIILQGHSLGCDRVVYYLLQSSRDIDFILLAPCDSYCLQEKWLDKQESVENQIERLKKDINITKDFDWLPLKEYGVYSSNEDYILPITRNALLSIIDGAPFKLFNILRPIEYFLNQACFIYIGGNDNLQTAKPETMFEFFKKRIKIIECCLITKGDHMMSNCEVEVVSKIVNWLSDLKK